MLLSYCVVNTNGREDLRACLEAIERHHPEGLERELIVVDNASEDGSAEMVRSEFAGARLIALERRSGKAVNDTLALREARGELCLLLNEDSELCSGAVEALAAAMAEHPRAGAAGARLLDPSGTEQPCAWRLPGVATALAQATFTHRLFVTQSRGTEVRRVGWAQSAAMIVRRSAVAEVGYLDPDFFVYSDETDLCKRLGDAGWEVLFVPSARAIHHEQLATDRTAGTRRIVEFHRNRDLYVRKHHGRASAALVRWLTALSYLPRALAALVLSGHDPAWYLLHARTAFRPRGPGLREAAAAYNSRLGGRGPASGSPARLERS